MNKEEKKEFINDHVFYIKEEILDKVCKLPDAWEGLELKWFIEDHFETSFRKDSNFKNRLKDYKNEVLINNLL